MKNYLKLLSFLGGHKKLFSLAVFAMFISSLFEGAQLSMLVPMTDRIFNKRDVIVPEGAPAFVHNVANYLNSIDPYTLFLLLLSLKI